MKTDTTQAFRATARTEPAHPNQSREKKHAAVERWLHRPMSPRNPPGTMRWFG